MRFLARLPPRTRDCERILFTAMDYGPRRTRLAAIENLWKCPSDVTVATLKGLLKRNNSRDRLDLDEVAATLRALVEIEEQGVTSFLDEVLTRRSMFYYAYLKDIRRMLSQILERKKGARCKR
jgi:hypothetical protein